MKANICGTLWCVRYFPKLFTYNYTRQVLLTPFYKWGRWGSEQSSSPSSFFFFWWGRLALSKHLLPILLFCLRKSGPDLTSVPMVLYFVCGMPPQHDLVSGVGLLPGSEPMNLRQLKQRLPNLTAMPPGQPYPTLNPGLASCRAHTLNHRSHGLCASKKLQCELKSLQAYHLARR